jgi:phage terminase large subunit
MLEEIENTKEHNYKKYEWEYLGKPTGSGIVPFENLIFRSITDEEVKRFDNIKQGCDWGYGVDPFSFVRMHYDKTRKKLYFIGEIYGVKLSNTYVADNIKAKGWTDAEVIADSAEPKSIAEMKTIGIKMRGAKKGAGSVEYGEKWLDDLEEIVIDPARCPNVSREFESIDYDTDRDGNPLPRLSGKDNHTIDATRYGCEDEMSSKGQWGWTK